ncbi:MAG: dihydrofolate reductase family protein [Acidimicrobiales bacterium]
MRQLYPHLVHQVDRATFYGRLRAVGPGRPAVRMNMIASADGASSVGALGGPADLAGRGAESALVEGGPRLNAQLIAGHLIDELCLTVSPTLVGGTARRIATGTAMHPPVPLVLAHVAEDDFLFLRYRRP